MGIGILPILQRQLVARVKSSRGFKGKRTQTQGFWPYVFTPTAHLVVTFGFSLSIMMGVTLLGVLNF